MQRSVGENILSKLAGAREHRDIILQIELAKLEDARETPATKEQRGQLADQIADIDGPASKAGVITLWNRSVARGARVRT